MIEFLSSDVSSFQNGVASKQIVQFQCSAEGQCRPTCTVVSVALETVLCCLHSHGRSVSGCILLSVTDYCFHSNCCPIFQVQLQSVKWGHDGEQFQLTDLQSLNQLIFRVARIAEVSSHNLLQIYVSVDVLVCCFCSSGRKWTSIRKSIVYSSLSSRKSWRHAIVCIVDSKSLLFLNDKVVAEGSSFA